MDGEQHGTKRSFLIIKSLFFLLCISIFVGNVQAENTFVKGAAKFLPADEAFKLVKAEFDGEKNLRITLDIAEGYYLYKSKFEIISTQPLAYEINYPSGTIKEDEYFGKQEVFYGGIVLSAKFRKKPDGIAQASLKFQGCSDSGLCYPPTTIPLTIKLNKGSNNHDISEISSIKNKMLNDNLVLVILGFLVSGILLSVTPCVLPMVPILSGIIISSGKRKARSLTFAYVLGVCFTYTSLGVFAGFTGTLLSSSIQNTNFLYFSSAMFLLFALMMLDVIRINIPLGTNNTISSFTERFMGGGITSVFLMGLFSALILSPCVAPPLAAAILFIGQSGDVFVGGLSLLFLALGMSLPLLLIGFTSKSFLPKPGLWMDYIKKIIGFILLAMSAYILRPLMPDLLFFSLLLAILAVAVFFSIRKKRTFIYTKRKNIFALLVLFIIAGSLLISNISNELKKNNQISNIVFNHVSSLDELKLILQSTNELPTMLDFYADWCVACLEYEKHTFTNPEVIMSMKKFSLIKADVTDNSINDKALLTAFNLFGPPAILFFDKKGRHLKQFDVIGFKNAEEFNMLLEKIIDYEH